MKSARVNLNRAFPIARELAFALLVGVVFGVSPLTPDDLAPSLAAGAAAGLAFLVYRAYRARTIAQTAGPGAEGGAAGRAAPRPRDIPLPVWLSLLVFALVFAPTLLWLYGHWTASVWRNNHGLFIPFVMFFLARSALHHEDSEAEEGSAWGFAFLGVGLLLVVLEGAVGSHYLSSLGLVVSLPGLSLLLLGRRRTWALRFVWLLGLFMIPIPTSFANHLFLRNASASGTVLLLQGLGVAVYQDHSVLHLAHSTFVVSEACSGFATLYSAVALTIFLICYCDSPLRRTLLLLACFPLALVANVIRTLFLVIIGVYTDIGLLDTTLHPASGVATFLVVLSLLYWMGDRRAVRSAFS